MSYIKYVGSISVTVSSRGELSFYHTPCTWDSTKVDTLINVASQMGADYLARLKAKELKRTDKLISVTVSVMELNENGVRVGGKFFDFGDASRLVLDLLSL